MKIKKLHIRNIASIIDETINFTEAPLSNSDVFLITGNMGSGKSTILDAICLALYNTTPRLEGRGKEKVKNNSLDDIPLQDSRRLMRHETGEASATLLFEGVDGVDYEAEWYVQRGIKKKATAKLNNVDWSLKNLKTGKTITASKNPNYEEVRKAIAEAVGLDYTQFCRTTMLAQGEFTVFLKSDEDTKGAILSKLTRFNDYTKAGMIIFSTTQEKKKSWDEAKVAASDTGLSETEIVEKNEELKGLEDEADKQKNERDKARGKSDWINEETRLSDAKTKAKTDDDNAKAVLQSEEYKRDELLVKQWKDTVVARQNLSEKENAEKKVLEYETKLNELECIFRDILDGQAFNEGVYEKIVNDVEGVRAFLTSEVDKVQVYENEKVIIAYLNSIAEDIEAINNNNNSIAAKNKEHDETLVPAKVKAKTDFDKSSGELTTLNDEIGQKDKILKGLNLADLYNRRTALINTLNDLKSAKESVEDVENKKVERAREQQRLVSIEAAIQEKAKRLKEDIEPALKLALSEKKKCEEEQEQMRDTVDKFAVKMRSRLVLGCTCPVCRQKVETLPIESELSELSKSADMKYEAAKKKLEECQAEYNSINAEIIAEQKNYERQKTDFDNDNSISAAEEKVQDACIKVGIKNITDRILDDIEDLRKKTQDILDNELKSEIEKGEALNNELGELRKKQTEKVAEVDGLRDAFDKAKHKVEAAENAVKSLADLNAAKQKDINSNKQNLSTLLTETSWKHDWESDADGFKTELQRLALQFRSKKEYLQTQEKNHEQINRTVSAVSNVIDDIRTKMTDWKDMQHSDPKTVENIEKKVNDLNSDLATAIYMLEQETKKVIENSNELKAYLSSHAEMSLERLAELSKLTSAEITRLGEVNEGMRSNAKSTDALLKKANEEYSAHLTKKPEISEEDTLDNLKEIFEKADSQCNTLNQQIGVLRKVLDDDKAKKAKIGDLREKAEQARQEYDKWQRLNHFFGSADGKVFRNIAQSYILGGLLNSANTYLQKLDPRYTLKAVPGTLHISLEDAYQGYATRGTDSLSGGESFLVSLALALALADIGQALAVDTLFIDEGFGTLSGQPLANAINTLRSLHGQSGRHVGIISHIQEVRDNIPVQIQVKQSGGSSSSTIEVCEVQ